jgi:hypothetical protein
MRGSAWNDDPAIKALSERGRMLRRVSDAVRARVLERARTSLAAAAGEAQAAPPVIVMRRSWLRVAAAAAAFLALVAAGAVAAFRGHDPLRQDLPLRLSARAIPLPSAPTPRIRSTSEPMIVEPLPRSEHTTRPPKPRESYAAELRLLQRAHAAYGTGNFARALVILSEHNGRFPRGRLAEERDALRVRSLVGAGRTAEARRAVAAFGSRFPRSVLLPRLEATLQTTE